MAAKIKPGLFVAAIGLAAIARGAGAGFAGDAEILGLGTAFDQLKALCCQAAFEKLANGRGPAGHAPGETPTVQRFKLCGGQHDLKPLATGQITHKLLPNALVSNKNLIAY